MIDIHCHILPSMDDGPSTMTECLNMAKKAHEQNIKTIIATPHHQNGRFYNDKSKILKATDDFQRELDKNNIPLKILPGQELRLTPDSLDEFTLGKVLPLANTSRYILIEFPSDEIPSYTSNMLYELQLKGYKPIIAHPERNKAIIQNPDLLYQLIKNGVLSQLTASSVIGYFGKKIQKFSLQLIESNLIHFIASDAHDISTRPNHLDQAYNLIGDKYGLELKQHFKENAKLLVEDKLIIGEVPEKTKQKKFLFF